MKRPIATLLIALFAFCTIGLPHFLWSAPGDPVLENKTVTSTIKINTDNTEAFKVEQDGVHDNTLIADTDGGTVSINMAPSGLAYLDVKGHIASWNVSDLTEYIFFGFSHVNDRGYLQSYDSDGGFKDFELAANNIYLQPYTNDGSTKISIIDSDDNEVASIDSDGNTLVETLELGHASDTTLSRNAAGDVDIEGNAVYRAGGTDVSVADGGTGASTAANARTNLGVAIGSDVQAYAAGLQSISGLTETNGGLPYGTADNTYAWLAAGTANYLLQANGAGAPSWTNSLSLSGNIDFDGGSFVFNESGADKDFRFEGSGTSNLLFGDAGNNRVGISTNSPLAIFHVDGSMVLEGNLETLAAMRYQGNSYYDGAWKYRADGYAHRMYWDSTDGSFLIATASSGTADNAVTFNDRLLIANDGIISMPAVYGHDMNGETIRPVQINNSGELGYDSSSIRGKTNVKDIEDTSWIYDLRPVNYEPKKKAIVNEKEQYIEESTGIKRYGLVAEEVEQVNPAFVFYDILEDGTKQVAGVYYGRLITPVLNELHKLRSKVDDLERRLEALEIK